MPVPGILHVSGTRAEVVATGRLAQRLLAKSSAVDYVDPLLTLTGLRICTLWDYSR